MKTSKLLKFTLSIAILTILSGNLFGQENASWIDMTADQNTTDSVVVNATLPYYVEPDEVINNLSGQYDPTTDMTTQGINSTFSWTQEDATGESITFNDPSTADGENSPYQTVTFPGTSVDGIQIGVREVGPGAGGCQGSLQTVNVNVISEPSFTVNDGSKDLEICAGATDNIQIVSIAGDQIDGTSNYKFLVDISKEMEESDGSWTSVGTYPHTDSVINVTTADGSNINVLEGYTFTCANDGTDDRVTEYTFDFSKGLNHHISRKSDYINFNTTGAFGSDDRGKERPSNVDEATEASLYSWYTPSGGSGNTITVTVYPTPNTGNIHYVPNDFDL
jgi:hypothetical protein